ncbi:MAG: hypothetical protein HY064_13080 [Bacteroidetes bacterium]|nr:hypothetical protein [Bacteroidota bacterium]
MGNHESNGHAENNDHDMTEGKAQYYPKGWWIPLAGLVTVALGFTLLAGFIFSHSGTDKWGKSDKVCNDSCCKNGNKCMDNGKCKDMNNSK